MKRALHIAACVAAYARLVFYVAIGWSNLPFSGWWTWPQNNIIYFGALLIILRGALFSILKLTPATSENDPWFEPKSGPSILLRQVVEMRIIRQERGDKTNHQDAEFAVFTRLPGYFAALSRHYIAPSDCAVTNEKSPAYGIRCWCLCKARFVCGYKMERFAFFRLMWLAPK